MRTNQLKQKLQRGETAIGTFMNCAYPAFMEICGLAGFDFAAIDLEHSPLDTLTAENLCRAADCTGISPVIRVRKNDGPQIQRALDIGSAGVQVPQVETKAEAEQAVISAKYSPLGTRGLSFNTRAGLYTAAGSGITDRLNEESLVVLQVEGKRGIDNLDEIITVANVDVIFLGPYDLSQSLGIPGQVQDSRVLDLMTAAVEKSAMREKQRALLPIAPKLLKSGSV